MITVLEMDVRDGCTVCVYLILLNCALNHSYDGKYYVVCVEPQTKKKSFVLCFKCQSTSSWSRRRDHNSEWKSQMELRGLWLKTPKCITAALEERLTHLLFFLWEHWGRWQFSGCTWTSRSPWMDSGVRGNQTLSWGPSVKEVWKQETYPVGSRTLFLHVQPLPLFSSAVIELCAISGRGKISRDALASRVGYPKTLWVLK